MRQNGHSRCSPTSNLLVEYVDGSADEMVRRSMKMAVQLKMHGTMSGTVLIITFWRWLDESCAWAISIFCR